MCLDRPTDQLAAALKRLRQRQRIGQQELAGLAGVSRTLIANIEGGLDRSTGQAPRPRPDTLRRLARGLATDGEGTPHPDDEETFYADMMAAAGYLPAPTGWSMADALRGHIPDADIPRFVADWSDAPIPDQQAAVVDIIRMAREVQAETAARMLRRNQSA